MGFRMSYMIHKAVFGAVRGGDNKKKVGKNRTVSRGTTQARLMMLMRDTEQSIDLSLQCSSVMGILLLVFATLTCSLNFGISVQENSDANYTFSRIVDDAVGCGATVSQLVIDWASIETAPGVFTWPNNTNYAQITVAFYAPRNMSI